MDSRDAAAFQDAIQLARSGQIRIAYERFCKLSNNPENRKDPDLLVWIAETSPLYAEAQRAIDEARSIAPQHPRLPQAQALLASRYPSSQPSLSFQTGEYRCPFCGTSIYPIIENRISRAGWLIFALLIVCVITIELCWLGLLLRENVVKCPVCNRNLQGLI